MPHPHHFKRLVPRWYSCCHDGSCRGGGAWRWWCRVVISGLLVFLLGGCDLRPSDPDGDIVSISYLQSLYRGAPTRLGREYAIRGVVVSSDEQGGFYKEIVIQDATGGIVIRADATWLYQRYPAGSTVTVRCASLTLGEYGGRHELGIASPDPAYQTERIPEAQIPILITVSRQQMPVPEASELTPLDFATRHISTYVVIRGLRPYPDGGPDMPDNSTVTWSGNRAMYSSPFDSVVVRTSPRAVFADDPIADYPIDIYGILSWFNGSYQLVISRREDIVPSIGTNSSRITPVG